MLGSELITAPSLGPAQLASAQLWTATLRRNAPGLLMIPLLGALTGHGQQGVLEGHTGHSTGVVATRQGSVLSPPQSAHAHVPDILPSLLAACQ